MLAAAVLLLLVLMVLPMTGYLARTQARMLVFRPAELIGLLRDLGVKELPGVNLEAGEAPDRQESAGSDYASQLGLALAYAPSTSGPPDARHQRLRALAERFPSHKAAILAHILRYAMMSSVAMNRDAEFQAYMTGKPSAIPGAALCACNRKPSAIPGAALCACNLAVQ